MIDLKHDVEGTKTGETETRTKGGVVYRRNLNCCSEGKNFCSGTGSVGYPRAE